MDLAEILEEMDERLAELTGLVLTPRSSTFGAADSRLPH
jgi:hypothetical protein